MKKIILASGSPRRQELLSQIGIFFEVRTSDAVNRCRIKALQKRWKSYLFEKQAM